MNQSLKLELKKQAMVSLSSYLDRQGFIFEPGFFIGNWSIIEDQVSRKELVIDRFDCGRNGVPTFSVPSDVIIKVCQ